MDGNDHNFQSLVALFILWTFYFFSKLQAPLLRHIPANDRKICKLVIIYNAIKDLSKKLLSTSAQHKRQTHSTKPICSPMCKKLKGYHPAQFFCKSFKQTNLDLLIHGLTLLINVILLLHTHTHIRIVDASYLCICIVCIIETFISGYLIKIR